MEKIMIVLVLAILSMAMADLESYSYDAHYGEDRALEDVKADKKEQYAIIKVTPISGDMIPTINYHDFLTHYLAIRDDKRETCYIFRSEKTLTELLNTLEKSVKRNGFLAITESYKCTSQTVVESDDLADRYGQRIADFCVDYLVIQSEKKFIKRTERSTRFLSGNIMGCSGCSFWACSGK